MAGTNLIQWNPTAANQETDAEYLADSQRAGGATNPSLFDATLANKLFYQMSTYLTGLFTAFGNKGFATSDASLAALTAQCANFLTTADVLPGTSTVAYAATVVFDCSRANGFEVTLTGNITSLTVINAAVGQVITLTFIQDGTGGRTVAFPSNVKSPGAPSISPSDVSVQQFKVLKDTFLHPIGPVMVS